MNKRDRERRQARRQPFRDPKSSILIVCEGLVTEYTYFTEFSKFCHNSRVEIDIRGGVGVPRTIVTHARDLKKAAEKRAKRESDDFLAYDEVWCVFDVDQHPNIPDAIQMARDNAIKLAISNPCFELWLWLHFSEQPGMQHRHDMQRMLREHIVDYDKHFDFSICASGYSNAVQRARRLDEDAAADDDIGRNPTTGVWKLTESIRKFA